MTDTTRPTDDMPAFPVKTERASKSSDPLATPRQVQFEGMTLRDYFAAAALQGIMAFGNPVKINGCEFTHEAAAYFAADAMLRERSK